MFVLNIFKEVHVRKRQAFTLIELLVVISVIALLLSILMPSLQKAKERAKAVVCQQNLKQWGYIFGLYTEEYNGSFMEGLKRGCTESWQECLTGSLPCPHPPPPRLDANVWMEWIDLLRNYHKPNFLMGKPSYENKFQCCPSATKPMTEGGRNPFAAWGTFDDNRWVGEFGDYGSYGINMFCYNLPNNSNRNYWRSTTSAKSPFRVPLLLDSQWVGGTPVHDHSPPSFDGQMWGNGMVRFCLNRHPGHTINAVFLDFNVRKVGLKELWELNWHRNWNPDNDPPPDWSTEAPWMENFKDYAY